MARGSCSYIFTYAAYVNKKHRAGAAATHSPSLLDCLCSYAVTASRRHLAFIWLRIKYAVFAPPLRLLAFRFNKYKKKTKLLQARPRCWFSSSEVRAAAVVEFPAMARRAYANKTHWCQRWLLWVEKPFHKRPKANCGLSDTSIYFYICNIRPLIAIEQLLPKSATIPHRLLSQIYITRLLRLAKMIKSVVCGWRSRGSNYVLSTAKTESKVW